MRVMETLFTIGGAVITVLMGAVAYFLSRVFEKVEQTHAACVALRQDLDHLSDGVKDARDYRDEFLLLKAEFEVFKKHNVEYYDAMEGEH